MRQTIDRLPTALTAPAPSSLTELAGRVAFTGLLLAALTVLASIALAVQN